MAPVLDPSRSFGKQVRRRVRARLDDSLELLDRAAATLGEGGQDAEDAVHLVRRHTKEVRALLRLLDARPTGVTRRVDREVRAAARALGPVRDSHVMAAWNERLGREAPVGAIEAANTLDAICDATRSLRRARARCGQLPTDAARPDDGLRRTYRACRRAHRRALADPSPASMHAWRIRNKRLWYQVRALSAASPIVLGPYAELLDTVGELLGEVHDLDVYREHLASDQESVVGRIEQERRERCRRALRLGATLHAESAPAFAARVGALWRVAARQGPETGP